MQRIRDLSMTWMNCKVGIENSGSKKNPGNGAVCAQLKGSVSLKNRNDCFLLCVKEELSQYERLPLASTCERRFVISVSSLGTQAIETSLAGAVKG